MTCCLSRLANSKKPDLDENQLIELALKWDYLDGMQWILQERKNRSVNEETTSTEVERGRNRKLAARSSQLTEVDVVRVDSEIVNWN
jgi:hypothetical protein